MKNINRICASLLAILIVSIQLSANAAAPRGGKILSEVNVKTGTDSTRIEIEFTTPVQYITHTNSGSNDTLQIKIDFLNPAGIDSSDLESRETVRFKRSKTNPVIDATYEGDLPGIKLLTIRFSRIIVPEVKQGENFRSIVIVVPNEAVQNDTMPPAPSPEPSVSKPIDKKDQISALSGNYVINLLSSTNKIDMSKHVKNKVIKSNQLYQTTLIKNGVTWHRLRLGFFKTRSEARVVQQKLGTGYPGAWVTKVAIKEINIVAKQVTDLEADKRPATTPTKPSARKAARKKMPLRIDKRDMSATMEQARKAIIKKQFTLAVRLYTKVLQSKDDKYHQDAQEFLGLARERNGQLAHAKAEYQEYLKKYPEGEGAKRVKQRLNALLTIHMKARPRLRAAKKAPEKSRTDVSGSFSQYYRFDGSDTEASDPTTDQSYLISDFSLTTRTRKDDFDIRTQFNGNYQLETLSRNDDTIRISNLYIDARDRRRNISAKVGRQSRSTGGVLGRFDGGVFSVGLKPKVKLNLVAGNPVSSTENTLQTDKYFYGASVDVGTFFKHWNVTAYAINQVVDDITDRTAIGSEIRYFDKDQSYFTLIDYDTSYDVLNTALFLANYRFPNGASLNLNADYRKSPFLTTTNALQGQGVFTIEDLLVTRTEDEIRALASDRTASSRMLTLSGSYPLTKKYQISADVTASELSSTPASGGVPATPSTGKEFYYSAQFLARELFKKGDISIIGLRYSDSSTASSTTFTVNSRYPLSSRLRANPRFIYIRQDRDTGTEITTIRPSLRLDYRWNRKLNVEVDAGLEWVDDSTTPTNDRYSYFVYIGFRKDWY